MKKVAILMLLALLQGCASGLHNFVTSYTSSGEVNEDFNLGIPVTRQLSSRALTVRNNGLGALAIDAQQQVVIASQEDGDYVAEVLTDEGNSSSIFADRGLVRAGFDMDESEFMVPEDIAVVRSRDRLSTGFVVAGTLKSPGSPAAIALAKFSIRGIDPGFGTGGTVITRIPTFSSQRAYSLTFSRSGRILVVGSTEPAGFPERSAVLRYHADGRLDTLFGISGVAQVSPPGGGWATGLGIAVDSMDRILTAAVSGRRGMIYRLDRSGRLDTSFGESGIVMVEPIGDTARSIRTQIAIDARDRVVFATGTRETAGSCAVYRFTASGDLDRTFGDDGLVLLSRQFGCNDMAIDSVGRIVVVGGTDPSPRTQELVVSRLLPDGRLDRSFADDGVLASGINSIPRTIAIAGNDSIVVGGILIRD